jgi:hypothetical protein
MATLAIPRNVELLHSSGKPDVVCLFALKNVTAADTVDLSSYFQIINRAVVIGVVSFVEIAAVWTGTVLTMPAGLAADAGFLLAWGSGT